MKSRLGTAFLGVFLFAVAGCTGGSSESGDDGASRVSVTFSTSAATTTSDARPSAEFCELASRAVQGNFDFTSDEAVAELASDSSLTRQQQRRVAGAADDARRQVLAGNGYSNELMVSAVNEICNTTFTPVTMVE